MTWDEDAHEAIDIGAKLLVVAANEIADLQEALAECRAQLPTTPPPTIPPPSGSSVFGFAGPDPTGKSTVTRVYLNPGDPSPKPAKGMLHFVTYKGPNDHKQRVSQAKTYDAPVLLGFHHEPEGPGGQDYSPTDYKKHWLTFNNELKAQNVTNVSRVWVMMGSSFTGKPTDNAANYYPGDALVDVVSADGYDWCGCKTNSGYANPSGSHRMFGEIFKHMLDFASSHNKDAAVGEVGSPARKDGSETARVAFVNDMGKTVNGNPRIIAVCYFQHSMPSFACDWVLKGASLDAYKALL